MNALLKNSFYEFFKDYISIFIKILNNLANPLPTESK